MMKALLLRISGRGLLLLLWLVLASGCKGRTGSILPSKPTTPPVDPLLGNYAAPAAPDSGQGTQASVLPPPPARTGGTALTSQPRVPPRYPVLHEPSNTNAALANGAPFDFPDTSGLRIAKRPEPSTPSVDAQATHQPNSPLHIHRMDDVAPALEALGVTGHRLRQLNSGQWLFVATAPNPQHVNTQRYYEARAADSIQAIQAVIDQIQREQK